MQRRKPFNFSHLSINNHNYRGADRGAGRGADRGAALDSSSAKELTWQLNAATETTPLPPLPPSHHPPSLWFASLFSIDGTNHCLG